MNRHQPDDRRRGLGPPRFRLSTLLLLVTVLCVIFAVATEFSPYASLVLILLVLAIAAHLAGGGLGTRLRESGDVPLDADGQVVAPKERRPPSKTDFAPATRLERHESPVITLIVTTGVGVLLGAALGGSALAWLYRDHLTILNLAVALAASGVLGGFFGFLGGGFLHVVNDAQLHALREDQRGASRDVRRRLH